LKIDQIDIDRRHLLSLSPSLPLSLKPQAEFLRTGLELTELYLPLS
jgi:hypothetical protein